MKINILELCLVIVLNALSDALRVMNIMCVLLVWMGIIFLMVLVEFVLPSVRPVGWKTVFNSLPVQVANILMFFRSLT